MSKRTVDVQNDFASKPLQERRELVASGMGVDPALIAYGLDGGGLDVEVADAFIENAIGTRSFAYAVLPSLRVNDKSFVVPFVVNADERDGGFVRELVEAVACVNGAGGFQAATVLSRSTMSAQVQLTDVPDLDDAETAIAANAGEILTIGNEAIPSLVSRGGGARSVCVRRIDSSEMLVVHIQVDCGDAMGANLVNTVAEAVAPRLAALARSRMGLRILSNLCDERRVTASCRVPRAAARLDLGRVEWLSRLDMHDAAFAEAHNRAIMAAVDGLAIATGNDWRAVEAGAHAYAARNGAYQSLARWSASPSSAIQGVLDLPLALGTVGGTLRTHRAAQLSLRILGVERASDLALVAVSLGLLSSFAFVKKMIAARP